MAVIISEIVTEVVAKGGAEDAARTTAPAGQPSPESVELIVRMAVERVLEVLRREWDR